MSTTPADRCYSLQTFWDSFHLGDVCVGQCRAGNDCSHEVWKGMSNSVIGTTQNGVKQTLHVRQDLLAARKFGSKPSNPQSVMSRPFPHTSPWGKKACHTHGGKGQPDVEPPDRIQSLGVRSSTPQSCTLPSCPAGRNQVGSPWRSQARFAPTVGVQGDRSGLLGVPRTGWATLGSRRLSGRACGARVYLPIQRRPPSFLFSCGSLSGRPKGASPQ